jgi:signal transduction histidine kinase
VNIHLTKVNINDLLHDQLEFFLPEAQSKGIEFKLLDTLNEDDKIISTDLEKLNSILTNLIKNAIKYTQEGKVEFGAMRISTTELDVIQCYVRDTGIGIPEEMIDKVFNRFIREDTNNKALYEGSGLGLSISKSYAEMLNGNITLNSELHKGSEFILSLPLN